MLSYTYSWWHVGVKHWLSFTNHSYEKIKYTLYFVQVYTICTVYTLPVDLKSCHKNTYSAAKNATSAFLRKTVGVMILIATTGASYPVQMKSHELPVCMSSTDLSADLQLEFPTWATTAMLAALCLNTHSSTINFVVVLIPRISLFLQLNVLYIRTTAESHGWRHSQKTNELF